MYGSLNINIHNIMYSSNMFIIYLQYMLYITMDPSTDIEAVYEWVEALTAAARTATIRRARRREEEEADILFNR